MSEATRSGTIAIIGAGITGLTLAAALRHVGIDCVVYEKATAFGEVGAGIQLAPNAVRLLHRLGLAQALDEVAVRSSGIEMRSGHTGALLGRVPLDDCASRFGAPYLLLTRADLHALLTSLVPVDIVRLGKTCQSTRETDDGVEIQFTDGTCAWADAVVGADGIRSVMRLGRVRDAAEYSGLSVYRGMVPAERLPPFHSQPRSVIWTGPGKHVVSYPVAAGRLVNFVVTIPASQWHLESWSEPGNVQDALDALTDWDGTVRTLVQAAESVTRWALHTRNADPQWSTRRTTLAGDAAHPMLPFMAQGANQGIEDAVALAAALFESGPADIPGALRNYELTRRRRATSVQRLSAEAANAFHGTGDPSASGPDNGAAGIAALGALTELFDHHIGLPEPAV